MKRQPATRVSCNLCQVDDTTVVFEGGVAQINQVVRCNRCGLLYASPRKDADHVEIAAWAIDPSWDMAVERPQRYEKERLQVRDYARTRALLNGLYPERGKLVELGSSMGFLLGAFRQDGWNVLGIDPDPNACRYATERMGIAATVGTLECAGLPDESVDVFVMLHVIEHVPDPIRTMMEIHRILKPGGHLVLETPRYDTVIFKLLGKRERSIACDGHIFFFTTGTLRRLYERAGFELVQLDYVGRSLTLDRVAYNVGVISRSKTIQRVVGRVSRSLRLQNVSLRFNLRDMQRVCVRKRRPL